MRIDFSVEAFEGKVIAAILGINGFPFQKGKNFYRKKYWNSIFKKGFTILNDSDKIYAIWSIKIVCFHRGQNAYLKIFWVRKRVNQMI